MVVFGREEQLAAIEDFVGRVQAGPVFLILEGRAGVGKSVLWQEGIAAARAREHLVVVARPAESEATLSFGVLSDLFGGVGMDAVRALPPPQRIALDVALAREDPDEPVNSLALGLAVSTLLRTLAEEQPLVIAVDDLQWADPPSARALEFALRRLEDQPVGLLASVRVEDGAALGLPFAADLLRRVSVGPLGKEPFSSLLHHRLGGALQAPLVTRVHRAVDGNPFFGIEVGRMLAAGAVPASGEPLPIPASVGAVLSRRITELPPDVRRVLAACALLARPTLEVLERLFDEVDVRGALANAVADGIVVVDPGRVRFTHPLFGAAFETDMSPRERRALHARIADALDEPEASALHRAHSVVEPDAEVAALLDAAAERAAQRGAPDMAALLLEHAARLTPTAERDRALVRVLESAGADLQAGNMAGARDLLDEVLAVIPAGNDRARALLLRARTYETNLAKAMRDAEAALAERPGDAALEAEIHRYISDTAFGLGDGTSFLEHARYEVEAAERSGSPELLAVALCDLVSAEFFAGHGIRRDLLERALALPEDESRLPLIERPRNVEGGLLKRIGEFDAARGILEETRVLTVERGDVPAQYSALLDLADLEVRAGRPAIAIELADRAAAIGQQAGVDGMGAAAVRARASALLDLGRLEEARAEAERSLALAEAAGIGVYVRSALRVRAQVDLAEGDAEEALPHLRTFREESWAMGLLDPSWWGEPPEIEALVALGRLDEAEKLVAELERRAGDLDRPLSRAVAARFRGLLASLRGDHDAAEDAFAEALVQHERAPQPLEHGRTLLALGVARRRARRRALAREALEAADGLFRSVGAAGLAERATAELGRLGLRRGDRHDLTAMERKVAEVIAGGATTREAAAALFLSPKTVEFHLRNAYRKLDVKSRAQLARVFPEG